MTDDEELADKIIASGVGTKKYLVDNTYVESYTLQGSQPPHLVHYFIRRDLIGGADNFVSDWRVAGAMMEKCVGKPDWMPIYVDRKVSSEVTHRCWIERTHSGIEVENYHARGDSLPRAINEACAEALSGLIVKNVTDTGD